ncbi:PREDICTED: huntingtin-like [Priapulus caudatus]|uniref:Huntingtin-like n=1 Tax=Priapulus caudatus TaxID=37621 RepID=A0ABM1DSB7_PRICU|nr:PREDICTED: huntingtin-like [Priapulus caudatus]
MANLEKLIKAFEALKTTQPTDSVTDEKQRKKEPATKKDQISHCNTIAEALCMPNLRSNSEFPKFLGIGIETLLACCDSPDADVRIVADECLNKTVKTLLETNLGRLQVELYKEIKKNGVSRSLRAALWRFADLTHLIRPQKCRPYIVNLLPCVARISKRPEESVQETLAAAMLKIFPVLGKFTNDGEVKVLLKAFLPNLKSSSAVCRRTAASSLSIICQHSRKPKHFFAWLLTILLEMPTAAAGEAESACMLLGVLMCLRHIVSHMSCSDAGDVDNPLKGSFGKIAKGLDLGVATDQLVQMFEMLLCCTQHSNHNVVTAALETMHQLLKHPTPSLLSILLSPDGIPQSQTHDLTQERLHSRSASSASLLPSLADDEAPLEDEMEDSSLHFAVSEGDSGTGSATPPRFTIGAEEGDTDTPSIRDSNSQTGLAELGVDGLDYSSMEIGVCQDSPLTEMPIRNIDSAQFHDVSTTPSEDLPGEASAGLSSRGQSPLPVSPASQVDFCVGEIGSLSSQPALVYCVRHLCRSFLLTGYRGCIIPDRHTRVSIKSLALGCIAAAVTLYPAVFFKPFFVQEDENITGVEDVQFIEDVCLYSTHSDPQLSGNTALLIGCLITALLSESRGGAIKHETSKHVDTTMQDLTDHLSCVLLQKSSVSIRLGLVALRSCLPLLLDSIYSQLGFSLAQQLLKLASNSYWLVKVELADVLGDLDYKVLSYLETSKQQFTLHKQVPFQDRVLHHVLLLLIGDEDMRVRQAAATTIVKIVPNLFFEMDSPQQDPVVTKARDLTCKFLDPVLTDEQISQPTVHGLVRAYSQVAGAAYSTGLESALSRVIQALMQKLIQSTSNHLTLGCLHVLCLLSEEYSVPKFPSAWTCATLPLVPSHSELTPTTKVNPALGGRRSLTDRDKWMKLNLQDPSMGSSGGSLALILNVLASTSAMLNLTAHKHALLLAGNIFAGAAYKALRPEEERTEGQSWSMLDDQAVGALADNLLLHLARLLNICTHVIEGIQPGPPQSKPVLPSLPNAPSLSPIKRKSVKKEEKKEGKEAAVLSSSKTTTDGTPDKADATKEKKEEKEKKEKVLLGSFFNLPSYMNLYEVMRGAYNNYKLLKALFGTNLSSQWEPNQQVSAGARRPGKVTRLMSTVKPGLYHCCFTAPAAQFTQGVLASGLRSPMQGEESISPGFIGWMRHKLDNKMPTIFKPGNREKAPIASYIRLFEPLVIKALKLYTITSSTDLQVQVLDLLAQLVQLRVNYCLLDSEQIFIGFVIKQFEYIEEGQIMNSDKLIAHIFHFLVLLSYERYHSKTIIGMPKIIQLCDGLMASGQAPITHAIPALQPIVVDLFAVRGTVNKADIGKELETQREVVVSMLFRLVHYHQVLDLFVLVLQHCHKDGEDKWKRLSRQIVDVLLPVLTNYEINLDDQAALEVLHRLFEVVAPSVFRPVDILLNTLLVPPKPLTTVQRVQRWMCLALAILRVLIYQAKEEVVLSRLRELGLYVTIYTDTQGPSESLSEEETLARFLLQVVGMVSREICSKTGIPASTQPEDCTFLCHQLSQLLLYIMHMFQSGIYRRVATAAMSMIVEEPPACFYSVRQINGYFHALRMTQPTLLLQWCNILTLLNYDDQSWWSELMQTHRPSATQQQMEELQKGWGRPLSLSLEMVRRGGLILFCDYVCENLNDTLRDVTILADTRCDVTILAVTRRGDTRCDVTILAVTRRGDTRSINSRCDNFNMPALEKKTLRCLEAIHHTQSGPLVALLIDRMLATHHLSIARMCDTVTCRRLEMLLADTPRQNCQEQLPLDDLEKLIDTMKQRALARRHVRLTTLLGRVRDSLAPAAPRTLLSPERSHPLALSAAAHVRDIAVNKDWLLSITWEQCCRADAAPAGCAKLLANLDYADQLATMKAKGFNAAVLRACVALGLRKTVDALYGARDAMSPSEQVAPPLPLPGLPEQREHPLYRASRVSLMQHISGIVAGLPTPHQAPNFLQTLASGKHGRFLSKLESFLCEQPMWSFMFSLAPALTSFLESHEALPWQLNLGQEAMCDICRFGVLMLEAVQWKYSTERVVTASELQSALDCFAVIICDSRLFGILNREQAAPPMESNVTLILSAVSCVQHILSKARNIQEAPSGQVTEACDTSTVIACQQITELMQWIEAQYCQSKQTSTPPLPEYLVQPMITIITGLARLSLLTSHARLPPLARTMGWVPVTSDPSQPPLPTEFLQERDVLRQFVLRANALGFTSRQQFEELWVTLLAVLGASQEEVVTIGGVGGQHEEMERVHVSCLVVQGLTALLMQALLRPRPGNPIGGQFLHAQRDKPPAFLQTRTGKRLTKVRGIIQMEIESLAGSSRCERPPGEMYEKIHAYNIEREDDSSKYTLGQVSVESIWSRAGMLEQDSQHERRHLAAADVDVDIHSCLQFLLENLYSMWMKTGALAHVALLTEAACSVVVLSDIFTEQSQFEWMLEVFLDLHKTHPGEDEILVQYLLVGICKAISVIGLDSALQERVSKLLEQSMRSTHMPTRVAAYHGVLYILESNQADFSATVMPAVTESLQKQLTCLTTGAVYGEKYVLVMWAAVFYILENYQEDLREMDFSSRMLQLCVSVASASEDRTPLAVYLAIFHGLERLALTGAVGTHERDLVVKLAVDRLKAHSPVRVLAGLGLLLSCMYSEGRVVLDSYSTDSSDMDPASPVLEIRDPEHLIVAMERLTMLFDRIRKGYPFEAEVVSKILPHFLADFFPTQDAMNKVIGEFLSSQQPHPQLIVGVLFKVFNNLIQKGQNDLVKDWVMLSLSNFTQRTPIAMATWSLTCFFISASPNRWLRALFPHVQSRMGLMDMVDRRFFCVAALDFRSQVVVLSDIFTEQSQFEWMLEVFLDLHKTHPGEDEILVQYLLVGICKAISVIGLDSALQERVSKLLEQSMRSTHMPTRVAAYHGVLYILESNQADFSATVMPAVTESLQKQLTCLTTGAVYGEKYVLVMWAAVFYILENYQEDLRETDFSSRMLQLCVSVASASEDRTPLAVYLAIFHGLERLALTGAVGTHERDLVVKLAVDRLKAHSPVRVLAGLGLLLSCMYSEGRVVLDSYSTDSSDMDPASPVLEIRDPEHLIVAMERLTMLFDRIRKGYPFEAEVVSKILPHFLADFFPTQDAMNKVIGEFLSSQQPHPQLIVGVLFKVFNNLIQKGQNDLVKDWVMLSLSNFTQRTPIAMATWSLTCFFISASPNRWLRALFPHVQSRMGLMDMVDRRFFCVAALDFRSQLKEEAQKRSFLLTMQAAIQPDTPYTDLIACIQSHDY